MMSQPEKTQENIGQGWINTTYTAVRLVHFGVNPDT